MTSLAVSIFFCAMSVLSLEIIWMRLFAIENFSSFGYMILSIALLGFGVGGVIVAKLAPKLDRLRDPLLFWLSMAFPMVVLGTLYVSDMIPFIPQKILQDPGEMLYIAEYYVVLALPFLVGSMILGIILTDAGQNVGRLYFADLLGSGLGGLVTLWAFYAIHPSHLPALVVVLFIPCLLASAWRGGFGKRVHRLALAGATSVLAIVLVMTTGSIEFSEYKGISYAMSSTAVTGAKVVHEEHGPLGFIQVVESNSERTAAGLSTAAPLEALPPIQPGLYIDGAKVASLARTLKGDESNYLDWMLSSLAYRLHKGPRVLLVGLGGGEGLNQALYLGASHITVVDIDPVIVRLVREWAGEMNGHLLDRPEVTVQVADGRDIARRHVGEFDLVVLNFFDASGLSLAGSKSHSENYLYTVEAFDDFLGALAPGGVLASLTPVEEPPRASLRVLPGLVEAALKRMSREQLSQSMMYVRSEFHGMSLLRQAPYSPDQIGEMMMETEMRGFKTSFYPGMTRGVLEAAAAEEDAFWDDFKDKEGVDLSDFDSDAPAQDPFFDLLVALLQDPDMGKGYVDAYPFDITPTFDNKPYFSAMLKEGTLAYLEQSAYNPEEWTREIPPDLWSQPLVWITLAQAALFSLIVVLVAYFLTRKSLPKKGKGLTALYFACLGLGYMFVEMVLIQKLTHYVAAPAYAAAIVLTGMLVFSGIGSFVSERFKGNLNKGILIAVSVVCALLLVYNAILGTILTATISYSEPIKIILSILLVGPIAFFMGMPFPLGMMAANRAGQGAAGGFGWAVNGAVSVVGVVAAQSVSMQWGFSAVFFSVIGVYALACLVFPGRWLKSGTEG